MPAHYHGLDRAQLDATVLLDGGNPPRQAARQADEEVLDRRDAVVLGREDLGMVGFERPLFLVVVLLAEAEEALHLDLAVHAVLPLGGRAPGELGGLGRALQHLPRVEQRLHVDSVGNRGHLVYPLTPTSPYSRWRCLTIHQLGPDEIGPAGISADGGLPVAVVDHLAQRA